MYAELKIVSIAVFPKEMIFSPSSGIYNPFLYVGLKCNFIRFIFRKVVAERLSMILCADLIQPRNFFGNIFTFRIPVKKHKDIPVAVFVACGA